MSKAMIAPSRLPGNARHHAALPAVLDQCQQVVRAIDALAALAKKSDWQFQPVFFTANGYDPYGRELSASGNFDSLGEADIAPLRQMLAQTERLLGTWQDLQRPATPVDIVKAIAHLLLGFPDTTRTAEERDVFQQLLCGDVAYEQPTVYELHEACRRVRKKVRFKSFRAADLLQEFAKVRTASKRIRRYFDGIPHMRHRLDQYEQDLPRLLIQRQRDAEQAEAEARKRLRQRIVCHWPPLSRYDSHADELRRLGLDGVAFEELYEVAQDELLARLDEAEQDDEEADDE
jgi:hypothetical protein